MPNEHGYKLSVNSYDRGASLLIALLVMVGIVVFALVIIWYANHWHIRVEPPELLPVNPAGPTDAAMGLKNDIEPPGVEDAPDLTEPQLQDTLTELSNLSNKSALLSDTAIDSDGDVGKGSGFGDSREAGLGGDGPPLKEPAREVRFAYADDNEYRLWLDYWKVELAVLDQRNNVVYYAKNFGKSKPDTRSVPNDQNKEQRIYFISNGTVFEGIDRQLVNKAGIGNRGTIILKFWPNESAKFILGLEDQAWKKEGKTSLGDVQRTILKVTRQGDKFGWDLEDQLYYN